MDYMKNCKAADRVRNDKHRIFNKELAHYLGLNEAIYIAYLVDQDHFFNEDKMGEPFYKVQYHIYYETTIKPETLRKLNRKFEELGLITIVKIGLPAKNYFQINYQVLDDILDKSMQNFIDLKKEYLNKSEGTSTLESRELEPLNEGNINNKELNNKYSISKDIDEVETSSNIEEDKELKNNNNLSENNDGEVLEKSDQASQTPAAPPRKGLAPLIEIVRERYDEKKDPELVTDLIAYLKAHLGCRRLPSEEKWKRMLDDLEIYSTISLPGTSGGKFVKGRALEIIQKAITGKDGAPFLEFDNIYNVQKPNVMEPQFNLNQEFKKGY